MRRELHEVVVNGGGPAGVTAAMRANMPVEQLADLELPYPTFTSVVGLAARRIVRELDPASPRQRAPRRSAAAEWEHSERG